MKKILIAVAFVFAVVLAGGVWGLNSGSERLSLDGKVVSSSTFVSSTAQPKPQRTITLFFYNANNDQDRSGNILCSKQGLVLVERQIPFTNTPVQDAVRLLLRGELTPAERAQGITTEFPLPGVELKGADLKNSELTLDLADPNNKTSGGACRAGILWAQIEATAKQFPEVKEVKFKSENLFQP